MRMSGGGGAAAGRPNCIVNSPGPWKGLPAGGGGSGAARPLSTSSTGKGLEPSGPLKNFSNSLSPFPGAGGGAGGGDGEPNRLSKLSAGGAALGGVDGGGVDGAACWNMRVNSPGSRFCGPGGGVNEGGAAAAGGAGEGD
jgi:hypothetical protein